MTDYTRQPRPETIPAGEGDPGATLAVRHQGEARIAQNRAVLPQKPGTATATGRGVTASRPSPRRILTQPCMACNRETGQPMCELCSDLEDAEDAARDDERRPDGWLTGTT